MFYKDDIENIKRNIYIYYLVDQCNYFYKNLIDNTNAVHLIPFSITFAILHLSILRERQKFWIENKVWDKTWVIDLHEKVDAYKKHFVEIYPQWQDWRKKQFIIKAELDGHKEAFG
ncbi:12302_t:CDS:1 [Funneliformis caledonium]|uniref:12302_t:CDS:1 n=1 Tax=Funneliformis caledonium TaxID=1117310 RepID=A0A9N9CZ93_9GLOM|nr:12302_t:CDS:1 [Funneliformis caledonium]